MFKAFVTAAALLSPSLAFAACPAEFTKDTVPACESGHLIVSADQSCFYAKVSETGNVYVLQYQPGVGLNTWPPGGPSTNWQAGIEAIAVVPGVHTVMSGSIAPSPPGICGGVDARALIDIDR